MITKKIFKTRTEWETYRNSRFMVGGSNIGTILGLNKYETPLAYWLGLKEGAREDNANVHRGRFMEDGIARWFEHETGLKVIRRSEEIAVYRNDKYPEWMQVAPDRELFQKDTSVKTGRPLLEIKDTRLIVDFDDPTTIPDEWYAQVQYQMAIMEREAAYLAINDGEKKMKVRLIHYDPLFAANIIEKACAWVERYILGDERPEPENGKDVQLIHPVSEAGSKKVGKEARILYDSAQVYKRAYEEAKAKFEAAKQQIEALFDSRDTLELDGLPIATFKTQTRRGFRTEDFARDHPDLYKEYTGTSQYRVLRLIKNK